MIMNNSIVRELKPAELEEVAGASYDKLDLDFELIGFFVGDPEIHVNTDYIVEFAKLDAKANLKFVF